MKRSLLVALALATPLPVLADDMGGRESWGKMILLGLALAAVVVLVIQIFVFLIEAAVYAIALPIGTGRAFGTSAVANLASFGAGLLTAPALLGLAAKAAPYGRLVAAAAHIGITLIVEVPIVLVMTRRTWRNDGTLRRRFLQTAIWTNLATCGTLHLALLLM